MDLFGQQPNHLPSPIPAPGLNGPSVQSVVVVVLKPGQGAMESSGGKAAILIFVLVGHRGPRAVSPVAPDSLQGEAVLDRLRENSVHRILVQAGHLGLHAVSPVALDKEQDGTKRDRLKHNNALLVLVPQHLLAQQLEGEGQEPIVCFHSPIKTSSTQDVPWRMLIKLMANPGAPLRQMPMVNM